MKNFRIISLALVALGLVSCSEKAQIDCTVKDAPEKDIIVKQLDINVYSVLDTVKTSADGNFRYKVDVAEGQPEFIYLFYGDTRIAALLLEKGEVAKVEADTLGNYVVSGSEGSERLAGIEKAYSDFLMSFWRSGDSKEMGKLYVDYYRNRLKYVFENSKSLTTIPILYQTLGEGTPVFSQETDGMLFRSICDSLKTVYPESRYVKSLEKEADRRMQYMELMSRVRNLDEQGYPDLNLPDINGKRTKLSEAEGKVVLLHFWTSVVDEQKIFNIDYLKPVYEEFHPKGFEIYAVCIDPDKAQWASVVKSQNLTWINVNDGLGSASTALSTYNVDTLPASILIVDGDIYQKPISGVDGLKNELRQLLK
ncbi:MAG: TlpA family protein disulfide reductase [Bacteroidales bacterium]|nr:TlpA family protein disulfide reductase [Bacteroidales bacterium]